MNTLLALEIGTTVSALDILAYLGCDSKTKSNAKNTQTVRDSSTKWDIVITALLNYYDMLKQIS